ncbi:hypothetical protein [Kangiella aquimarina]|uniref:Nickel/cobalt transporter regulator n=1 Tax=Kangiella aquimarina TaxID=261965 RepID=A0ABZ0X2P4_9GAMM|nr:hypothetical protein [Kangiella aquimarina]WQG84659.1 hypothetical protein SR900_09310 [Kangiella aquimarina]
MKLIKPLLSMTAITLVLGISSSYAMYKGPKNNQGNSQNQANVAAKAERGGIFHDDEIRIIREYYHDHDYGGKQKQLPKGLQKKYQRTGELPPGWEMKLQRGEVLSDDVYRYGRPLPYDLRQRLPIGPVGSKIIEVEGKIIRVMENTREIIDILNL